jgi:stress response protein YsnF
VAHSFDHDLGANLRPLSEISNYTIEKGDPDPRGYAVVSADGRQIGRVEDLIVDTSAMKVRYLVVDLADDVNRTADHRSILLPTDATELRDDSNQVIARSYTGAEATYTPAAASAKSSHDLGTASDRRTLTRTEEELHVGKREVSRGEARVSKHVETEHVSEPVTRRREEVVIERRPVEAGARAHAEIG